MDELRDSWAEAEKSIKTSGEKSGPKQKESENPVKPSNHISGEQLRDGWAETEKTQKRDEHKREQFADVAT